MRNERKCFIVLLVILLNCLPSYAIERQRGRFLRRLFEKFKKKDLKLETFGEIAGISGTHKVSLNIGTEKRTMFVHIPKLALKSSKKTPLVIMFHGGGGHAEGTSERYGMIDVSDKAGFICITPNGTGRFQKEILLTWNVGVGFGAAKKQNVDDIKFIDNIITQSIKKLNIDPDRVYLTGMSNGGFISYLAGACLSDKIAAIAPVCATIGGKGGKGEKFYQIPMPEEPVSVCAINGGLDKHVPFKGGKQMRSFLGTQHDKIFISIANAIKFWVDANKCTSEHKIEKIAGGKVIKTSFHSDVTGADVILYKVKNGGHAWPGSIPFKGLYGKIADKPTNDISASKKIWEFFKSHPKIHMKLRPKPTKWPGNGM